MKKSIRTPLRRSAVVGGISTAILLASVALAPAANNSSSTDGPAAGTLAYYSNNYTTGANPMGVATDGTNVWTANSSAGTVTKLTAATGATVGTYTVGTTPTGIVTNGGVTWVTNKGANTVSRITASTGVVTNTYTVGSQPTAILLIGTTAWIANSAGSSVSTIIPTTGTVTTYTLPANPVAMVWDGANFVYVALANNTLAVCSTGGCSSPGSIALTATPTALGFDGENIWVGTANSLLKYLSNGTTSNLLGTYPTARTVRSIAYDQPGFSGGAVTDVTPRIWALVTDSYNASIEGFNAITGAKDAVYPGGYLSRAIAFDGQNLWLTNWNGMVTKIRTR